MLELQSRVVNLFLYVTFDELSYFCAHEARDAFKTAGEGVGWSILHDENLMKYLNFDIFQDELHS